MMFLGNTSSAVIALKHSVIVRRGRQMLITLPTSFRLFVSRVVYSWTLHLTSLTSGHAVSSPKLLQYVLVRNRGVTALPFTPSGIKIASSVGLRSTSPYTIHASSTSRGFLIILLSSFATNSDPAAFVPRPIDVTPRLLTAPVSIVASEHEETRITRLERVEDLRPQALAPVNLSALASRVSSFELPGVYPFHDSGVEVTCSRRGSDSSSATQSSLVSSERIERVFSRCFIAPTKSDIVKSAPNDSVDFVELDSEEDCDKTVLDTYELSSADIAHWPADPPEDVKNVPTVLSSGDETFVVLGVLGRGGCGRVVLAETDEHHPVAIKVIHKMQQYRYRNGRDMLLQELSVMKRATESDSRTLMTIMQSWEDKDNVYFVMPWCPDTLRSRIQSGEIHPMDAKRYCAEMALALKELHDSNTMHRDLKPENFLIDYEGGIILCDFGLSYTPKKHRLIKHKTFGTVGTAGYFAPEEIDKKKYMYGYDCKADTYSLGLIFLEVLAGLREPVFCVRSLEEQSSLRPHRRFQELERLIDDEDARSLLRRMLRRQSALRPSADQILSHPYFNDIDWEALRDRSSDRFYLPEYNMPSNTSTSLTFSTFHRGLDSDYASYCRDSNEMLLPNEEIQERLDTGGEDDFTYP